MTVTRNTLKKSPSGSRVVNGDFVWPASAAIPAQDGNSQNFALPGVEPGDCVHISPEPGPVGLTWWVQRCTTAGFVTVVVVNATVNPIDPAGLEFSVRVL